MIPGRSAGRTLPRRASTDLLRLIGMLAWVYELRPSRRVNQVPELVGASSDRVPLGEGGLRQGKVNGALHADEDLIF